MRLAQQQRLKWSDLVIARDIVEQQLRLVELLVFERSRSYVLVYHDRQHVETRPVETAGTTAGRTYLNGGVTPGERVVSRNALLAYHTLNQ